MYMSRTLQDQLKRRACGVLGGLQIVNNSKSLVRRNHKVVITACLTQFIGKMTRLHGLWQIRRLWYIFEDFYGSKSPQSDCAVDDYPTRPSTNTHPYPRTAS